MFSEAMQSASNADELILLQKIRKDLKKLKEDPSQKWSIVNAAIEIIDKYIKDNDEDRELLNKVISHGSKK